jgi:glycosyltransferase involved in cell wall biosynthesis
MGHKIVYYTDAVGFGGAEQCLLNFVRGLDRREWEPIVMHHDEPGLTPMISEARRLGASTVEVGKLDRSLSRVLQPARLAAEIRSLKVDVFHAHLNWPLACGSGLMAAWLAGVPAVVATVHLFVEMGYGPRSKAKHRMQGLGVDRYIAVSHHLGGRLRDTFRIAQQKVTVIHNGIPTTQFDGIATPAGSTWKAGDLQRPIVLCLARLDKQKGIGFLLQAAQEVEKATFVLVGEGPERAHLVSEAKRLGVSERVVFLGHRNDVPQLLAGADLFVLPSLWEGLPLSILEAMAANKAVIATAVGGTPEAITHGATGLLVPPSDPAALARAIRSVLEDSNLAQRLARAGHEHVNLEFSIESMVRRTTAVYRQLLDGPRNGRKERRIDPTL